MEEGGRIGYVEFEPDFIGIAKGIFVAVVGAVFLAAAIFIAYFGIKVFGSKEGVGTVKGEGYVVETVEENVGGIQGEESKFGTAEEINVYNGEVTINNIGEQINIYR
jgi:hypothetical protein